MKGKRLIYYLIIWLIMTAVYTTAVIFYYKIPVRVGLTDSLVFTLILFALGFSMWFAIRYMDIGIKNLPELTIAHLVLAGLVTYVTILITMKGETLLLSSPDLIPEDIIQAKVFTGILMYALLVMTFYFTKYRDSLKEKDLTELELRALLQDAELNLLKTQLNPHFIFNSLNSISSLTITDPDRAREMVIKLSEFLRYSLGKGKSEMVSLEEELTNINLFLDIEKTRFGDRLRLEQDIEEKSRKILLPVLILQPLVENAVKFSVYDSVEGASIQLTTRIKDSTLTIEISNPYDPRDVPPGVKGIGLSNVQQRLLLIYGSLAEFKIVKANKRFLCQLNLPLGPLNSDIGNS